MKNAPRRLSQLDLAAVARGRTLARRKQRDRRTGDAGPGRFRFVLVVEREAPSLEEARTRAGWLLDALLRLGFERVVLDGEVERVR